MRTAPAGRSRDVNAVRGLLLPGMVVVITALIGVWLAAESRAQAPSPAGSIAGGWTLNKELSDKPQWDAGKLVSEVSGLGPGKITETYAVDPEHHQLMVTVAMENSRMPQPMTQHRVYDAEPR